MAGSGYKIFPIIEHKYTEMQSENLTYICPTLMHSAVHSGATNNCRLAASCRGNGQFTVGWFVCPSGTEKPEIDSLKPDKLLLSLLNHMSQNRTRDKGARDSRESR